MKRFTIYVEADDASDAMRMVKDWAEDVGNLACYPAFPREGEWRMESSKTAVKLRAYMNEGVVNGA